MNETSTSSQLLENKSQLSAKKLNYDYLDLVKFETPNKTSTFGKILTSDISSSPQCKFGTCDREKAKNVYLSKDLEKMSLFGKHSPGVYYNFYDKNLYKNSPKWTLTDMPKERVHIEPKYDYYTINELDINPTDAYLKLKPSSHSSFFGLASRFENDISHNKSPGPKYEINANNQFKSSPKISLGYRREKNNIFGCTPDIVGPASYCNIKPEVVSKIKSVPKVSFPRKNRDLLCNPSFDKNQTYNTKPAIGKQVLSNKKTAPAISFGSSGRGASLAYSKHFFAHNAQSIISLPMPVV